LSTPASGPGFGRLGVACDMEGNLADAGITDGMIAAGSMAYFDSDHEREASDIIVGRIFRAMREAHERENGLDRTRAT
jgi:hypothetical protein